MRSIWRRNWGVVGGVGVGIILLLLRQLVVGPAPVNWAERGAHLIPKEGRTYLQLGIIFEQGRGVPPNWWLAYQFYREGCRLGSRESCHREARLLQREERGARLVGEILRSWLSSHTPVERLLLELKHSSPIPLWIVGTSHQLTFNLPGPRGWTPCFQLRHTSNSWQVIPATGRALPICGNLLHWIGR